jgi:hypothetical protein
MKSRWWFGPVFEFGIFPLALAKMTRWTRVQRKAIDIFQPPVLCRLVPTKTTNTAVYAAVAAKTSLPVLSVAPSASISPNRITATEVTMRLALRSPTLAMMIVGTMRARPPNRLIIERDMKACFLAISALLTCGCFFPTTMTRGSSSFLGVVRVYAP